MERYTLVKLIALFLLIIIATHANVCDYPVKVTNGTDCKGVLLSDKQFIEASNNKRKIRLQDLQIAEYKHLDELHEARHKMYKDELKDAKNELKWYEIKTNFGYILSFAAGAVITGFIAKEVLD